MCRALVLLSVFAFIIGARADDSKASSVDREQEIMQKALDSFDQAVSTARTDPTHASELYSRSAGAFETLRATGHANAAVCYNLGNAYFRLGDIGRAVLNYRRAERLAPTDAAIATNLKYARDRVEPYITPTGSSRLINRLMFWTNHTSPHERFMLAALCCIAGWLLLTLRLWVRSRGVAIAAVLLIILGVANSVSVAWQLREEARFPDAVIVKGEQTLRLGRGEGYDAAITQQLGPGVETRIRSERGGWLEIELVDGKTGWLPAEALERV